MENVRFGKYDLQRVLLTSAGGNKLDIKLSDNNFTMFYEEDLFRSFTGGELDFSDFSDAGRRLPIVGEETLELEYKILKDAPSIIKKFHVYDVSVSYQPNASGYRYKLKFCSEPVFHSCNKTISRSYKNRADMIIKSLLGEMKAKFDAKNISQTTGNHHFVIPNLHPLDAIKLVEKYAASATYTGGTFFTFENSQGYNFKCLEELYVQKSLGIFSEKLQTVPGSPQKRFSLKDLQVSRVHGDSLKTMFSGGYAGRCVAYDPIVKTYTTTTFDYQKEFGSQKHLNKHPLVTKNFKFKSNDQRVVYVTSNSLRSRQKYKQIDTSDMNKLEDFLLKRDSVFGQIRAKEITFKVSGDDVPSVYDKKSDPFTIGKVIEIEHHIKSEDRDRAGQLDNYLSGKYLITRCRHKFNYSSYEIEVVANSDSNALMHEKGETLT